MWVKLKPQINIRKSLFQPLRIKFDFQKKKNFKH